MNEVREAYDVALAEFDFNGEREGDLSFKEGDEVIVLKQLSDEWWKGKSRGKEGIFPAAYVKLTGEVDYATAEEEAARWADIAAKARSYGAELTRRREAAEAELENERRALEEANAAAAEARAQAEKESKAQRDAKKTATQEEALKKEIEINKRREEAEKRHEEARKKLVSVKLEEDASLAQIRAASEKEASNKEKVKKKKDDDERFADPLAGMTGKAPVKGAGEERERAVKPTKFAGLGGGDKCVKCGLTVGHAERVKGPGDSIYHTKCLQCSTCGKVLMGGNFSENNNMPYCAVCYGRGFGIKGFGFGGSVVANDGIAGKDGKRVAGKVEIDEISPLEALKKKT
jgi:hypothetical protein